MNTSRLLIAAACSLTVIGASSVAFAQTTTSPDTSTYNAPNQYPNQTQTQNRDSRTDRPSSADNAATGTMDSTTPRSGVGSDSSATGASGTPGGSYGRPGDTVETERERAARIDRN